MNTPQESHHSEIEEEQEQFPNTQEEDHDEQLRDEEENKKNMILISSFMVIGIFMIAVTSKIYALIDTPEKIRPIIYKAIEEDSISIAARQKLEERLNLMMSEQYNKYKEITLLRADLARIEEYNPPEALRLYKDALRSEDFSIQHMAKASINGLLNELQKDKEIHHTEINPKIAKVFQNFCKESAEEYSNCKYFQESIPQLANNATSGK